MQHKTSETSATHHLADWQGPPTRPFLELLRPSHRKPRAKGRAISLSGAPFVCRASRSGTQRASITRWRRVTRGAGGRMCSGPPPTPPQPRPCQSMSDFRRRSVGGLRRSWTISVAIDETLTAHLRCWVMGTSLGGLQLRTLAASESGDFENAARLRDQLSLLRGMPDADPSIEIATSRLARQQPGKMGLGTSDQVMAPPPGWKPQPRPDNLTRSSRSRRGGR
jgi:hypothetical protein